MRSLNQFSSFEIGSTVSPLVRSGHAADHFFAAIKNIVGLRIKKCPRFLLKWQHHFKEEAQRRLAAKIGNKPIIVIHPGSGSPAKNWPAEKFALLAEKIKSGTNFEPLVLVGEADAKPAAVMRSLLPGFHFFENLSLRDAASLLSISAGFIGNDSGITHLAAALGVPVVALFGPTDPAVWAPRGKNVSVIKGGHSSAAALGEIAVDRVFDRLLDF